MKKEMKMSINYKDSGVDVEAGAKEVKLIKGMVEATHGKEVLSSIGGFSGLFSLESMDYKNPVLVSGTDGVGTKVIIAQSMDINDTVGIDCVAMCVNDILCQGAKPLFFLDYIGTAKLEPHRMAEIVKGVTEGCKISNMALIGGETAEMPGVYHGEDYDLAGFAVGIVDKDKIIDGSTIEKGDIIFGLSSSGIHSNGYSLVRKIVSERSGHELTDKVEGLEKSLGETLLTPTRIYVREMLDLMAKVEVKGACHITGGGYYENIPRMMPKGLTAMIDVREVKIPYIFELLKKWGNLELREMYSTFNMGLGMVFVVKESDREKVLDHFKDYDSIYEIGKIVDGDEIELKY